MNTLDLFTRGQGGYHTYRIPALVITLDGTILAFCEARLHNGRDCDKIDILLRRSFDGGYSWEAPQTVIADGERTCGNPCPVIEGDSGTVILPFCKDNQQSDPIFNELYFKLFVFFLRTKFLITNTL